LTQIMREAFLGSDMLGEKVRLNYRG
jgi:hypothetical protein